MPKRFNMSDAKRISRPLFISAILFSILANLLMLTGPLFMLQIYDRVLSSRSEETLVSLFILVGALYMLMALLDFARGRVMARIGARIQDQLGQRVFQATLTPNTVPSPNKTTALRDLDALQSFYSSPAFLALMDVPWTPIFLAAIFIFHPYLGLLAVTGGALIILLTAINQFLTYGKVRQAQGLSEQAHAFAVETRQGNEVVLAQGMQSGMTERWLAKREQGLVKSVSAADWTGSFTSLIKSFRLFLQSAMLALGAYLVLQGHVTGGAMIASSIMLGRALAPVEQLMGQWPVFQRYRAGLKSLSSLLTSIPKPEEKTALPTPQASVSATGLSYIPVGTNKPVLRNISFRLDAGHALGVIGRSGSGKSTLAKALLGLRSATTGEVRIGGATLSQYGMDDLGKHIGYLPQEVTLFTGTIAENIARMSTAPDSEAVVSAAKRANAHELITNLSNGYDTVISGNDHQLSGGQRQRIALARALYSDPVLLILDEPNSALDADGSAALNTCVRKFKEDGKSVIIMTHRPAAISECDMLMVLEAGAMTAFGPSQEVMKAKLQNSSQVARVTNARN